MLIIILYFVFTLTGLILFKFGSSNTQLNFTKAAVTISISPFALLGLFSYVVSFILWIIIIQAYAVSYIMPFSTGIVTLATFFSGVIFFKEDISLKKILGLMFIVVGVVIINL